MDISILGAGNVATHIARALQSGPYRIVCVYSRTLSHAECLAREVAGAGTFTNDINCIPPSDILLFALKDDAVQSIAAELHRTGKHEDALWVHTSGSLPLSALVKDERAAVVYPLQTFSKSKPLNFAQVPLFVEGADEASVHEATTLAHALSPKVLQLDSRQRASLHLAGVFANNFANHCIAIAAQMLRDNDLPAELLRPIVEETVNKLRTLSPIEAQTGPAVRWDENIMAKHLQMLSGNEPLQQLYRLMSRDIHEYSKTNNA